MSRQPPPSLASIDDTAAMVRAVGLCITAWANVELHLAFVFRWAMNTNHEIADAVLATPRSFEVRSLMIHNALRMRLANTPVLSDWNLIYSYVCLMSKQRNQVAHATMILNDSEVVLEPFFVISQKKPNLKLEEVVQRSMSIHELDDLLNWFVVTLDYPQPEASGEQAPDLLLRLRTEDGQKREAQRAQQKPPLP